MIKKRLFKDKCDKCDMMKVCKGFNGWVLCEECIKLETIKQPKLIGDADGQTKFNF